MPNGEVLSPIVLRLKSHPIGLGVVEMSVIRGRQVLATSNYLQNPDSNAPSTDITRPLTAGRKMEKGQMSVVGSLGTCR